MSTEDFRDVSDDELVERFRELKSAGSGSDPGLTPPDREKESSIREEMERRGLAPDREDLIPDSESPEEDPIVEDRA
jgi:hypothetical protein